MTSEQAWRPHGIYTPSDKDDWLAMRRQLVTASEIPTLCGCFGDGRIAEMVVEKRTGERGFKGNLKTDVGSFLEPFIWQKVQAGEVDGLSASLERTHWNDQDCIHFGASKHHGATPDIVEHDKSGPRAFSVWNMKSTGIYAKNLPKHYMRLQVNWEMHVTGALHGGIIALNISAKPDPFLQAFSVVRDEALIERMVEAADAFQTVLNAGYSPNEIVAEMQAFKIEEPKKAKAKKGEVNDPTERL